MKVANKNQAIDAESITPTIQEDPLWKKFREGDEQAFASLYNQYIKVVYNYSRIYFSDEELIRDCIQEMFADLWRRRAFLGKVISIRFYLFQSIKRKIKLEQTRQKRKGEVKLSPIHDHMLDQSDEDIMIRFEDDRETLQKLEDNLHLLTDLQRQAIILKFYKDMSPKEISVIMVESVANVYKLISRGLSFLKNNMEKSVMLILFLIKTLIS